jgi:tRNA uridine 5-carboxymethylaminomethyl modification enzyme
MFTSRAEYRLSLREDNADFRLTEIGRELGLVGDAQWDMYSRKRDAVALETERLKSTWVNPHIVAKAEAERVLGTGMEREYSLLDLLARPNVSYETLATLSFGKPGEEQTLTPATLDADIAGQVIQQIEIRAKYQGYIDRQADEVQRAAGYEQMKLPAGMDYAQVRGLSKEVQLRLNQHQPETIGQASRIQGITPAAISLLLVHLKKGFGPKDRIAA